MGRLDGKVALISGGARGIGGATATRMLQEGAKVVLGDVLDADGTALAAQLGEGARYVHLDVTKPADWERAVGEAVSAFGGLSILVNSVHPGVIQTPMTEGMTFDTGHVPLHRIGQPLDVADLAVYLAADESSYVTGAEFVIDGGETAGSVAGIPAGPEN